MGMSHEINGNNCYLTNTSLQMSGSNSNCLFNQTSVQSVPQLITGLEAIQMQNNLNAFNSHLNALDFNNSLIIKTNDFSGVGSAEAPAQQILLVSSPMDQLMAVTQAKASAPQQTTAVQMVLQTTDLSQLNVIQVPTNLLLTDNNLIVIPQEGIALEVPALDSNASQHVIDNQISFDSKSQTLVYNGSPQLMAQQIQCYNSSASMDQLVVNLNDCIAINAINNESIDNSLNANQYFQSNHQIFGIIDGNTNEPKLLANSLSADCNDVNAFLASSLSSAVQHECDPDEAKGWLNDSLIAYRAMAAFKKVMPNETPSPTTGIQIRK